VWSPSSGIAWEVARILVIDGGVAELDALCDRLRADGHALTAVVTGREGLARTHREPVDLVLVEGVLPDMTAFDLLRQLRATAPTDALPVVLIGPTDEEIDRVVAFELGVDDYVVKPFSHRELALRVRAILGRRRRSSPARAPSSNALVLQPDGHRVLVEGRSVPLTALELRLLATLSRQAGRVLTRAELLGEAWGDESDVSLRTVDAAVKRLRQKLGRAGDSIQTVRGVGYRFVA
jgi:two-component system, OmpR family, phosphate regulon response regulator PhoB